MLHVSVWLLAGVAGAQSQPATGLHCTLPLVTIASDGSVAAGSKDAALAAFRAGHPIRVGWSLDVDADGKPEISHWADSSFLTEFEGEVFAQFEDIQSQAPVRNEARVAMPTGRQRWTGLLGTNGVLESHFDDGRDTQSVRVRSEWCIDERAAACVIPRYRLVYQHDAEGRGLAGSKEALIEAVRRGYPLRLAWGSEAERDRSRITVEHAVEPVFTSIMEETEVFVQVPEHIAQVSYFDPEQARFEAPAVMWRGLLGTTGSFDAVFVDRATGVEVRRLPQRARIAWFALAPEPACASTPLDLAVPGGVRRIR